MSARAAIGRLGAAAIARSDQRGRIAEDAAAFAYHERWAVAPEGQVAHAFAISPDFRSLAYARMLRGDARGRSAARVLQRLVAGRPTLYLPGDLGRGLFLLHAFATILNAERLGDHCFIGHGVTLGADRGSDRRPTLGDRVVVYANASVLGPVTVGDDAIVAAHALVLDDVPPRAVVAGVPARVVRLRDADERPALPPLV